MIKSTTTNQKELDLGQEAWLRNRPLPAAYAQTVRDALGEVQLAPELLKNASDIARTIHDEYESSRALLLGDHIDPQAQSLQIALDSSLPTAHYRLDYDPSGRCTLAAADAHGALYGLFYLLRCLQLNEPTENWPTVDGPKVALRALNHWDNVYPKVDIERGYGGETLFKWDQIAGDADAANSSTERLNAYARLLASVGINGLILNNVNVGTTGSQLLRQDWLPKVAHVATVFRAWGIRVGLSISYATPTLLGELTNSDPREATTRTWWKDRTAAVYQLIPDFLGYLVKADSEGQPGPMDFGLDHAKGAQHLADALAPHGGTLFWRAFVYGHDDTDIMAQPYQKFKPLDGQFAKNVTLQVKNGPRDFQVREPIHPLFGAMESTSMALEVQITQEYLGHDTHLCFLPSQWETYLKTPAHGHVSLADILYNQPESAFVGVANTNDAPNWTGHIFAQANLYGFGRLTWNPHTTAAGIATDWARLTFDDQSETVASVGRILRESWKTVEGYTAPFSLGQLYNQADTWDSDHFDPAPWTNNGKGWFFADKTHVGVDRTHRAESEFIDQLPKSLRATHGNPDTCPEDLLLFFHKLPWTHPMAEGKTLIQAIYDRYHKSAERIDSWIEDWTALANHVDAHRHAHVLERLHRQRYHARLWARYVTSYLRKVSTIPDASGRSY